MASWTVNHSDVKILFEHRASTLIAALAILLCTTFWLPVLPIIAYAAVFISSSLLYWAALWSPPPEPEPGSLFLPRRLLGILAVLLLVRLTFLGGQPAGSDDVYRYMWDGHVQAAGVNPYRYAPSDTALTSLHGNRIPALVNHPQMKTIYFPLCQWIFRVGYLLSGDRVWGFQVLAFLFEILTVTGLLLLCRERAASSWNVLFYAASPLIILQFSLDAHVDVFGFPFLIFGLLFYYRRRLSLALVLMGLSLLVKPVALVLLPVVFLAERTVAGKAKVILIPATILVLAFAPYMADSSPFEALRTFSEHWFFNGMLFSVLFPLFGDNWTARVLCFAVLSISLVILYLSKRTFEEKLLFATLVLLLCSPVAHPWYIGWLVVLLPLLPVASGIALGATASLTSITFVTYQLQGIWKDYPLVLFLEYAPVLILLYWDLRGGADMKRGSRVAL